MNVEGFQPLHVVAGGALAAVRTLGELAVVRIGLVAVHALLEGQRLFEIAAGVALGAIDAGMFAFQRELGLRVIEALVDAPASEIFFHPLVLWHDWQLCGKLP